jgi:hypothetical protein
VVAPTSPVDAEEGISSVSQGVGISEEKQPLLKKDGGNVNAIYLIINDLCG